MTGHSPRRLLIYSGNMFNELPDVPYVITMEVPGAGGSDFHRQAVSVSVADAPRWAEKH